MAPSLALVRLRDGHLVAEHRLKSDLRQLSIRHLSADARGRIALAMQWQGARTELPPLVGLWTPGDGLRTLSAPAAVQRSMRNYCGSVAFASDGRSFVVRRAAWQRSDRLARRRDVSTHHRACRRLGRGRAPRRGIRCCRWRGRRGHDESCRERIRAARPSPGHQVGQPYRPRLTRCLAGPLIFLPDR